MRNFPQRNNLRNISIFNMHDNFFNNSFSLCSSIKVNFVLFIKARRYVNIKHYVVMKNAIKIGPLMFTGSIERDQWHEMG